MMPTRIATLIVVLGSLEHPDAFQPFLQYDFAGTKNHAAQRARSSRFAKYMSLRSDYSTTMLKLRSGASTDDDKNDSDENVMDDGNIVDQVDFDSISDEETLLACRAYLQRRNKLGSWTESQRRKRLAEQASAIGDSFDRSSVGYFWEDPEQLVYWKGGRSQLNETLLQDNIEDMDIENRQSEEFTQYSEIDNDSSGMDMQENEVEESQSWGDQQLGGGANNDFTGFPLVPPDESKRRSEATKKKWQDPQWKAMWYEKRWGPKQYRRISDELERQKKLEQRIQSLPQEILASPELASMSTDQISEAVRTYVVANRKRSQALKHRAKQRKIQLEQHNQEIALNVENGGTDERQKKKKTDRDVLFSASQDALEEAQRKRSERAAKAYQTRLANQQASRTKQDDKTEKGTRTHPYSGATTTRRRIPSGQTPRDALIRIQSELDHGRLPSLTDVELILHPRKLGRRKELLRKILSEHFGLRGKCVPEDFSKATDENVSLTFVTQCSVEKLGTFVMMKMREDNDLKENAKTK